jgi:prophage maintenance system killer protein
VPQYLDLADYLLIAEAVVGVPAETIARPLPDGNKRVAYLALVEFLGRNGIDWAPPSVDETVRMIEEIAAGRVSARELAEWLRVSQAQG